MEAGELALVEVGELAHVEAHHVVNGRSLLPILPERGDASVWKERECNQQQGHRRPA